MLDTRWLPAYSAERADRGGWEKKSVFDWWDFVECIGSDGGYAKRSCHLNTDEISDRLKEKGVE
jgi:hypothetical protein